MTDDEHFEKHLDLCKQIYLRLKAEGNWPWQDETDSPKSADMVESKDQEIDT